MKTTSNFALVALIALEGIAKAAESQPEKSDKDANPSSSLELDGDYLLQVSQVAEGHKIRDSRANPDLAAFGSGRPVLGSWRGLVRRHQPPQAAA